MNPTPIGGDPGAPQDTTRLMLTAVMLVSLYGVWSFFLSPRPDPAAYGPSADAGVLDSAVPGTTGHVATNKVNDRDAPSVDPVTGEPVAPPVPKGTPKLPEQLAVVKAEVQGHAKNTVAIIEGGYEATVTNQGGQLLAFVLNGYGDTTKDIDQKTGALPKYDLVNDRSPTGGMVALRSRGGDVSVRMDDSYQMVAHDRLSVDLERETAEGVKLSRHYAFDEGRFGFTHTLTLKNESAQARTIEIDLVMNAVFSAGGGSIFTPSVSGDVVSCRNDEDREGFDFSDLEDGPGKVQGAIHYAVSSDQYFLSALLPVTPSDTVGCTMAAYVPAKTTHANDKNNGKDGETFKGASIALQLLSVSLRPGESKSFTQKGFFGPKQLQLLELEGSHLDENIEFGIFGVLSKPILWLLIKLYDATGNFGFAIILLTLIIKALTFPLTQKSYVSMQQMKILGPELKKLQADYAHDRAALGQKQMDLYKEKGINPLAGCFPVLVQMPVWFALYRTLWTSVELYQKPFVSWITDLSQPDLFPLFGFALLPFVVGALMLYQTSLSPPPQDQPQMKYILWAMPVMFTVFMFGMPAGLSLYMITNSALTMAQQLYIKKKYAVPEPDPEPVT